MNDCTLILFQVIKEAPKASVAVFAERLFLRTLGLVTGGSAIHGIQESDQTASLETWEGRMTNPSALKALGFSVGGIPAVLAAEVAAFR